MKRFFGRLANDQAVHDEETLKAIRDNVHGLQRTMISSLTILDDLLFFQRFPVSGCGSN